jgi:hypothetical protein
MFWIRGSHSGDYKEYGHRGCSLERASHVVGTYYVHLQSQGVSQARNQQKQVASWMNSMYKIHSDIAWSKSARNNERVSGRVAIISKGT